MPPLFVSTDFSRTVSGAGFGISTTGFAEPRIPGSGALRSIAADSGFRTVTSGAGGLRVLRRGVRRLRGRGPPCRPLSP